jgi:hypothetical protein
VAWSQFIDMAGTKEMIILRLRRYYGQIGERINQKSRYLMHGCRCETVEGGQSGSIPVQWEPVDLIVSFQLSAWRTSGMSKVNGGWWGEMGQAGGETSDCCWSYGWTPCNV